jgi:hypothetical protein
MKQFKQRLAYVHFEYVDHGVVFCHHRGYGPDIAVDKSSNLTEIQKLTSNIGHSCRGVLYLLEPCTLRTRHIG